MRLGGRLAAAIEILDDMQRRHRPAAEALKDWGLSHRFAGSGDRSAIGNVVYDALRRKRSAGWLLGEDTPRAQAFGALMLESGETPASLDKHFDGDKFAPPPLSAVERATVAERMAQTAPDAIRADCPDWCIAHFQRAFGVDWTEEARALAQRPPLDLRANILLAGREQILMDLAETQPVPTALAQHGIRIPPIDGSGRHPNVQVEPAFQKGWFEVQDEGSQLVAHLAGAKPGMNVLDYCAGGGGKTLAMAMAMQNSGRIVAHDADKARLAPIFDRLRRAEAKNVEVVAKAADLAPLAGSFDLVLVDAPCTGSGTWRRKPDAKWRLSAKQLDARRKEQTAILDTASAFVRPGGLLAYITCSVFAEENADQVAAFTARNDSFQSEDHAGLWSQAVGHDERRARIAPAGISLTPARSDTDGFFFAALRRVS